MVITPVVILMKVVVLPEQSVLIQTSLELSCFVKKNLPEVQAETGLDVHLNITALDALKLFEKNPEDHMTLSDFIIMERKVFEDSGTHISDRNKKSGQWLNTKSGARLVCSYWDPDDPKLTVGAGDLESQGGALGVRHSRCFF